VLVAGQNLLLNKRLCISGRCAPEARRWELEAIGFSEAALGLTRRLTALQYDDDLFIQQRQRDYWHGHLQRDWLETERGPALNCKPASQPSLLAAHTRHPASGDLKMSSVGLIRARPNIGSAPGLLLPLLCSLGRLWQRSASAGATRLPA
jgi:hypothetical protein